MPATETRFFRKTSDIIANNYSPYAKELSARIIWQKSKSDGREYELPLAGIAWVNGEIKKLNIALGLVCKI